MFKFQLVNHSHASGWKWRFIFRYKELVQSISTGYELQETFKHESRTLVYICITRNRTQREDTRYLACRDCTLYSLGLINSWMHRSVQQSINYNKLTYICIIMTTFLGDCRLIWQQITTHLHTTQIRIIDRDRGMREFIHSIWPCILSWTIIIFVELVISSSVLNNHLSMIRNSNQLKDYKKTW
jgi:hypothetical protein